MDAASKFAALPGIAFDQPDCYETSDLPESDQRPAAAAAVDSSANVEILNVDPGDAYKRFQDKSLTVSGADFSGTASGKGYQSYGQWGLTQQRDEETPLEKYRRLQIEVQELQQTFENMTIPADESSKQTFGDIDLKDVCSEMKSLDSKLKQIDCDSCVDGLIANTAGTKTLSQLEQSLRPAAAPDTKPKSGPAGSSNAVMYELSYPADAGTSLSLHQLEERVRSLEQLLGSGDKVSLLSGATGATTICETVRQVSRKVMLMDPAQLDQLDARLNTILEKVSSIADRKSAVDDLEQESRVNEVIQLIRETEGQRSALPAIAARLSSLSELEEQAIQFSGAISYIDSLQRQTTRDLVSSQEDLNKVRESLNQNMSLFRQAVESFEKRLSAASK
jgi:dynactin-2